MKYFFLGILGCLLILLGAAIICELSEYQDIGFVLAFVGGGIIGWISAEADYYNFINHN